MSADGDPHSVWVARMHDDAAQGLRALESDSIEGVAGIGALVESIAVRRGLAIVGFTRRDVDDVRIGRRECDVGDRRGVVVEDRFERGAAVRGLEDARDREAEIVGRRVLWVDRDGVEAAAWSDGADTAPVEPA